LRDDVKLALDRELQRADKIVAAATKLLGKPPALEDRFTEYARAWVDSGSAATAWRLQELRGRLKAAREGLYPEDVDPSE
jgi:hypothetical protein